MAPRALISVQGVNGNKIIGPRALILSQSHWTHSYVSEGPDMRTWSLYIPSIGSQSLDMVTRSHWAHKYGSQNFDMRARNHMTNRYGSQKLVMSTGSHWTYSTDSENLDVSAVLISRLLEQESISSDSLHSYQAYGNHNCISSDCLYSYQCSRSHSYVASDYKYSY